VRKTLRKTPPHRILEWLAVAAVCLLLHRVAPGQPMQHGKVEGNTYVDGRFGLRYTFPGNLEVQTSVGNMPVGTGEKVGTSEFLLSVMEKPTGRIRRGVFITSDPVGTQGITQTQSFLNFAITRALAPKDPPDIKKVTIAGRTFYESKVGGDAAVPGGSIHFYGAQIATSCSGHFLVFCFSAASPAEVDELLGSPDRMEMSCSASSK